MLKSFLKGLVVGSVAGGVGTLLTVPRSGNETRAKLAQELDVATQTTLELNNSLTNFKKALQTTQQTAQAIIPAFTAGLEQDITDFKFQAEPRIAQIKDQVKTLSEHVDVLADPPLQNADTPVHSKEN
ncbi:YtxH domain-containing protein [Enterococcus sp. SMC-9]|uniref:YtxH domain-containing protein n=1 Tax=Enterococcus sp. SMC-9 TaxID=2862343 RepID=UPI001E43348C|nr:YtxH domain-containing protein [Enterococcus sp. SMC-9]MCD1024868.1 YtxH domain-containing protein [Enterococcus sp. SMC-9]